jgi:hypothetical protein
LADAAGEVWVIMGGRNFTHQATFDAVMDIHVTERGLPDRIVHFGHHGAEQMAEEWAQRQLVETIVLREDNARDGAQALQVRNEAAIGLMPALVIIVFNGLGWADLDRRAKEAGIPVHLVVRNITAAAA